ncbi:MAG: hypothetical protein DRP56_00985 [Planctomycetota bacterium]|nr:MAG: hypothetical protein DRP56_00985 [Planctomycetota bacterium]
MSAGIIALDMLSPEQREKALSIVKRGPFNEINKTAEDLLSESDLSHPNAGRSAAEAVDDENVAAGGGASGKAGKKDRHGLRIG